MGFRVLGRRAWRIRIDAPCTPLRRPKRTLLAIDAKRSQRPPIRGGGKRRQKRIDIYRGNTNVVSNCDGTGVRTEKRHESEPAVIPKRFPGRPYSVCSRPNSLVINPSTSFYSFVGVHCNVPLTIAVRYCEPDGGQTIRT